MNKKEIKTAFTLAEILITISILGIIVAITIPAALKSQTEALNRTKVKKAMSTYEKIINNIVAEKGLETQRAFNSWAKNDASENDYSEQLSYFKIAEKSAIDGLRNCRFKTSDGIWWDICAQCNNIANPIIILDEKLKNESRDDLEVYARREKDSNGKKLYVYALLSKRDNSGVLRVNDNGYINSDGTYNQKLYMNKLYNFLAQKTPESKLIYSNIGGYNVAVVKIPDDYDDMSRDYMGSPYNNCGESSGTTRFTTYYNNYYDAAKRYCEENGGRLPTKDEFSAIAHTPGADLCPDTYPEKMYCRYFIDKDSNPHSWNSSDGYGSPGVSADSNKRQVICIRK